jgi:hypothetical protein
MTAAALTTPPLPPAAAEPRVLFRRLLKAEWIKLRSLRSVVLGLVLATAGVLACNVNAAFADRALLARRGFVLDDVFTNNAHIVVLYVFGGLGAIVIVSEHGSGLIRTTFAAVPDRAAVIGAKAVVAAAVTTVAGLLAVAASYVAVAVILAGRVGLEPLRVADVQRYLACSVLLFPVAALVGLGLGVLIRHAAIAMIAVTTLLAVLPQFVTSQRHAWVNDLHNAMPFAAWQRLRQPDGFGPAPVLPGPHGFAPPTAAGSWLVYAAWPLAAMALALVVVRRRDV